MTTEKLVTVKKQEPVRSDPMRLVLQLLSYALWAWTIIAVTWLTSVAAEFFINKTSMTPADSTMSAGMMYGYGATGTDFIYPLAATVVLLLLAAIVDFFYAKREPLHKTGAEMVFMVIHAVIAALFAVGSLVFAVFAFVNLTTGINTETSSKVGLIVSLVAFVLWLVTFLRDMRHETSRKLLLLQWVVLGAASLVAIALAVFGPIANEARLKNDRLIENGLGDISNAVQQYAREHDGLPTALTDVKKYLYNRMSYDVINKNLIRYTPGEKVEGYQASLKDPYFPNENRNIYKYQMCVTYIAERTPLTNYAPGYKETAMGGSTTYPDTYTHKAGDVCYDLATDYYGPIPVDATPATPAQ